MNLIGNLIWIIFGGLFTALMYYVSGLLLCITIIGIPFGVQLIKFGNFALLPFGKDISSAPSSGGALNTVMNILWILLGWWEIASAHLVLGLIFCATIIGIPFGLQHFKLAWLSLFPFGKSIK